MAKWADIAGCYRWLHDKAEKNFNRGNALITIPVIILSTLMGTANFALSGFIPADNVLMKNYAQAGIGAVSIFAGILTTVGNFLRYAQNSEAHRVAGLGWGKLHRQITVEVAIHPDDREDSMTFLQLCRQDLDRLVEQSPAIPDNVISAFEKEFSDVSGLQYPDICHGLEHTAVYNSSHPRLMRMVADATIYLKQRKKLLRDDILPDLSLRISNSVGAEVDKKIEAKLQDLEDRLAALKPTATTIPNVATATTATTATATTARELSSNSFDWRRFIHRNGEDRPYAPAFRREIYRDTHEADQGQYDSAMMSVQSETPASASRSIASSDGIVLSMKVNPNPTPLPTEPPVSITIPKSPSRSDLSGSQLID